ncbi:hypothetical protein [Aliarcobacter lanthieri]|uniref:hypothetical protein n=1 Tax=Aliarcobacter lanthieri TaxID=1355374 RepID=UPI003AAE0B8F
MKYKIKIDFFDVALQRDFKVDEVVELEDKDIERLSKARFIEVVVFEQEDNQEAMDILTLKTKYLEDKEIVKNLKADGLMALCSEFGIEYTNVKEAKKILLDFEVEKES